MIHAEDNSKFNESKDFSVILQERGTTQSLFTINSDANDATTHEPWIEVAREKAKQPTTTSPTLRQNRSMLKGTGSFMLKSAPKRDQLVKVFLTRISVETTAAEVKDHISNEFALEVDIEKLKTKYLSCSSSLITTTNKGYNLLFVNSK